MNRLLFRIMIVSVLLTGCYAIADEEHQSEQPVKNKTPSLEEKAKQKSYRKLTSFWKGDLCGFKDKEGNVVITPKFERTYGFYVEYPDFPRPERDRGVAGVMLNGKWGFIDEAGAFLVPPRYDFIQPFSNGMAVVQIDGKRGYVNLKGVEVVKLQFEKCGAFSNGMAPAWKKGKKAGYINREGHWIIVPQFESAGRFSEGLASVQIKGRQGYINHKGDIVIQPQFDKACPFSNGKAQVHKGNKIGIIDKTGKFISPLSPLKS